MKTSYCKLHDTYPQDDEPCWTCIREFGSAPPDVAPCEFAKDLRGIILARSCNKVDCRELSDNTILKACNIIDQQHAENKRLKTALLNIASESITANTLAGAKSTAREALKE